MRRFPALHALRRSDLRNAGASFIESASFHATLLLLFVLPLPFGSHFPVAETAFATATFVLLALWGVSQALTGAWPRHLGRPFLYVLAIWLIWIGWIHLQTLPWPSSLLASLAPHRVEHLELLALLPGIPAAHAVAPSVDVSATRHAAMLSAAYVVLFVLIAAGLREPARVRRLMWTLLLAGLAQALYGSAMMLSGLEYGAWGPKEEYRGFATGTFVNRNHFAGFLEICIGAAIGLLVASRRAGRARRGWRQHLRHWIEVLQDRRTFARIAVGVMLIGLILSQSRMGNVAAIAGVSAAGLAFFLLRPKRKRLWALALLASIVIVDIWFFGRWFGVEQLAERYATVSTDATTRLDLFADVQKMIPVYGAVGSGLSTFAVAYPEFRSREVFGFADHAHNDYLQFLIETGVPGVVILGTIVVATLLRGLLILRRRSSSVALGAAVATVAAVGAIAVHSLADFNLQIPAVAAHLMAVMAMVWSCSTQSRKRHRSGVADSNPAATPGAPP